MANPLPIFGWATAAPTDTSQFYQAGTFLRNSAPAAGSVEGWECTVSGNPGTWLGVGAVTAGSPSTVTAAATLTAGSRIYNLTGAGTYTLFPAASVAANALSVIVANGVTVTVAPAAANTIIGATTLASTSGMYFSNGTNTFYKG